MQNICEFLHMRHNFRICDFENAMRVLAKYAIAYLHITSVPKYVKDKELIERIQHRFTRMLLDLRRLPYLRGRVFNPLDCILIS